MLKMPYGELPSQAPRDQRVTPGNLPFIERRQASFNQPPVDMAKAPLPTDPQHVPEPPQATEQLMHLSQEVIDEALFQSRGAAVVNMAEAPDIDPQALAAQFSNYHTVSVQELLEQGLTIPKERNGLIVTGYSSALYANREQENRVESLVRATADMRGVNSGWFRVLVLTNSLPNPSFLHNSSLPWYNGPFQGDESIWSLRRNQTGIELVRHTTQRTIVRDPKAREVVTWIDTQTIPFPLPVAKPSGEAKVSSDRDRQIPLILESAQTHIDELLHATHATRQFREVDGEQLERYGQEQQTLRDQLKEALYALPTDVACIKVQTRMPLFQGRPRTSLDYELRNIQSKIQKVGLPTQVTNETVQCDFVVLPPYAPEAYNALQGAHGSEERTLRSYIFEPLDTSVNLEKGISSLEIVPIGAVGGTIASAGQIPYRVPMRFVQRIELHSDRLPLTPALCSREDDRQDFMVWNLDYPFEGEYEPRLVAKTPIPASGLDSATWEV